MSIHMSINMSDQVSEAHVHTHMSIDLMAAFDDASRRCTETGPRLPPRSLSKHIS